MTGVQTCALPISLWTSSVKRYPVRLDVHKVMVVGDWAMAHVNFRNLEKRDAGDLGYTAVDMFTFNDEDKEIGRASCRERV